MAQERNEMTGPNETAEIKSEIERTRVEMTETLGEIQERLRPEHLIQQAKDTVAEAATGKVRNIMTSAGETATVMADQTRTVGRSVADYVRMHPVQTALVAGGLTWWLLRNRGYSDDWEGASEGWQDTDTDDYASHHEGRSVRERAGEYVSSARGAVSEYAGSARSSARRAGERMRSAASNASVQARQTWQRTSTTVDDWVHENPFAAGAVAIAVGCAIGLSAPRTEWEDRTMGESRDQAMEKARSAARDLRENVSQKVQNVADTIAGDQGTKGSTGAGATGAGAPGAGGNVGVSGTSPSTSSTPGRV